MLHGAVALLAAGCFQENLPQIDIPGTVVVPRAAATRVVPILDEEGEVISTEERFDTRFLGPVFIGAYAGIEDSSFGFPHPTMGPVIGGQPGNTFPYGGTTAGRFDFACYESIKCKVVTGRFTDYADILDYFKNSLGLPVRDQYGEEIVESSTFQQHCYDYNFATSDGEMSFLGSEQFTENADGDFEASFLLPHTTFVEGMAIWGFMDAPAISLENVDVNGTFTSCNRDIGRVETEYNQYYYEGAPYYDVLNIPTTYLGDGDWTADGTTFVTSPDEQPVLRVGIAYSEGQ